VVQADAREEMPQRTPASESLLISMVEVSDLGQILPVRVVQADNHEVMIQRTSVSESLQFPMVEVTDWGRCLWVSTLCLLELGILSLGRMV
jgi:hypothetical protein